MSKMHASVNGSTAARALLSGARSCKMSKMIMKKKPTAVKTSAMTVMDVPSSHDLSSLIYQNNQLPPNSKQQPVVIDRTSKTQPINRSNSLPLALKVRVAQPNTTASIAINVAMLISARIL